MGLTKTFKDGSSPTPELGGTWWSNTCPNVACDVKSIDYAFSFEPNYDWSSSYAGGAEIWDYLRRVARKHHLYDKIRFRTEITHIEWDDGRQKWVLDYINLSTGDQGRYEADIVFAGMGPLRIPKIPKEFEAFEGPKCHTAHAIQVVPGIVNTVKHLDYYQRTASYVVPRRNVPTNALWKFLFRYMPFFHFIVYKLQYWASEYTIAAFSTKLIDRIPRLVMTAMAWLFRRIQIRNTQLRKKLTPKYEMGCRRIVVSSDYYPALARKNVDVHTEEITGVKGNSILLKDGTSQEVDVLVLATGFHVQNILPSRFMIGKDGADVKTSWGTNPQTYYGLTSPETPNMFFLLGPNIGLGHNSVLFMVETQVEYALKAISHMMKHDLTTLEVTSQACRDFADEVDEKMKGMVWSTMCNSWYQNKQGRVTALWWSSCSHY
ncbi:hypothetical protein BG006_001086 [Podila minutissima]|uniref:Flavin-containing monooxygenase n=1 Tax=Podila minutissima TaxID=64525 RepID=A0A9P5VNV7_9FUNG|nr:hypothetical protein BG006_001086 [Podila minutissima]